MDLLATHIRKNYTNPTDRMYEISKTLVSKWIPWLSDDVLSKYNGYISSGVLRDNYWLVSEYVKRITPYADELKFLEPGKKSNVLTAGLFCFTGQCLIYHCQYGNPYTSKERYPDVHLSGKEFFDVAFSYALMYVYADYFLDGVHLSGEDRQGIMFVLLKLLHNPWSGEAPPGMVGLLDAYKFILKMSPESQPYLIKVFMSEVEGMLIQNNPNSTRLEYFNIAERKGGLTGIGISAILGMCTGKKVGFDPDGSIGYQIGAILQLLDDMIDVLDDIEENTHTIATHDLQKYGNLDSLFIYTVIKVDRLPDIYNLFKFLLYEALCYTLSQRDRFTPRLVEQHRGQIHINWGLGNKAMVALDSWLRDLISLKIQYPNDPYFFERLPPTSTN